MSNDTGSNNVAPVLAFPKPAVYRCGKGHENEWAICLWRGEDKEQVYVCIGCLELLVQTLGIETKVVE